MLYSDNDWTALKRRSNKVNFNYFSSFFVKYQFVFDAVRLRYKRHFFRLQLFFFLATILHEFLCRLLK